MNNNTKALAATGYSVLIGSIVLFMLSSSTGWGILIAWPIIVIGFVVWAILLTVADKNSGSDKKAVYQRNQKIFLVLLLIIVVVTFFTTVGSSLLKF